MAWQRLNSLSITIVFLSIVGNLMSLTPEEKQKCIEEFLEWCKKNEYYTEEEQESGYFSLYSTTIRGQRVCIYCTVDYEGRDCLKEKKPWYHCFPNNSFTYKGRTLHPNSTVDDEICATKHRAYQTGYSVKFNKTAFKIRMNRFHKRMQKFNKNLYNQMQNLRMNLQSQLSGPFNYRSLYYDSNKDSSEEDSSDNDSSVNDSSDDDSSDSSESYSSEESDSNSSGDSDSDYY